MRFREFLKIQEGMFDSDDKARNDLSPKGTTSTSIAPGLERKLKATGPGGSPTSSSKGGMGGVPSAPVVGGTNPPIDKNQA